MSKPNKAATVAAASPIHKGLELDKSQIRSTIVEVDKNDLINEIAQGAGSLTPMINKMTARQLRRVMQILLLAPIAEPTNVKLQGEHEAILVVNFMRLQDLKIALVELLHEEQNPTSSEAE